MINKRRRLAEELSEVADDMGKSIKNNIFY